jgi:magnesium transporter
MPTATFVEDHVTWVNIQDPTPEDIQQLAVRCSTFHPLNLQDCLTEIADTLASHRIDQVVRLLTVATVLTLPLTLLATLFGMNIALPFSKHPLLFYLVLGLGMVFFLGLLVYFWQRRWL